MSAVMRRHIVPELPWHPLLLGMTIVVSFWLDTGVSPFAAVRSLLVVLAGVAVMTLVTGSLLRSAQLGGLAVSGIIGLLWVKQLVRLGGDVVERTGVVLTVVWIVLIVAALAVAVRLVLRARRRMTRQALTKTLNKAAGLLVLATILFGVLNGRLTDAIPDLEQGVELSEWSGSHSTDAADLPDIYAILLDGYPRADVLDFAFDIDNSPFLSALEERGFDVADASHSEYIWTHVTLPSLLNMAYVEHIPAMVDVQEGRAPRQPTLRRTISDSEAFRVARSANYTTVAVHSGFEEVAARQADVFIDGGQLNEFELNLLMSTFLGDLVGLVAPDFASNQQRDRILHTLEVLPEIAATPGGPWFVFSHVPAPHSPIVFRADGAPVTVRLDDAFFADSPLERGQSTEEYVAQYRAQLPYLNERILASVDGILEASRRPPVILLFADHGSASRVDWTVTAPADAPPARVLERTGILFAVLTPGRTDVYPDETSPVNIFRHLFDAYLGTEYGPAEPPENGGQIPALDPAVLDE